MRLEDGGPAGVRARWLASWCYGRSTGGVRMSKEREWRCRCRCRCRCSARCQTQTSVTRLAVACPGPAQLLGGADVGVAQQLAWSATREQQQQRGVDSAPVAGTRLDLTECGWAETGHSDGSKQFNGAVQSVGAFQTAFTASRRDPPEIHAGRDGAAGDWTACVGQTEHSTACQCHAHCGRRPKQLHCTTNGSGSVDCRSEAKRL